MTTEVPTANWDALFAEIPVAIEQLLAHDAHCSREAAYLLEGTLHALKAVNSARAWDEIVPMIGRLAIYASDARRGGLPQATVDFLDRVENAFSEWNDAPRELFPKGSAPAH